MVLKIVVKNPMKRGMEMIKLGWSEWKTRFFFFVYLKNFKVKK